jgi:DNA polymerase elongation subunit (family B)
MIRGTEPNNSSSINIHIREISSCRVENPYSSDLYLFGNNERKQSVVIKVVDFKPYFFVEKCDLNESDFQELLDDACQTNRTETYITNVELCYKVMAVGYTDSEQVPVYKVIYEKYNNLKRIVNTLKQNDFKIGGKYRRLTVYHEDWSESELFLHENDLKMQTWINVKNIIPSRLLSSCTFEYEAKCAHITGIESILKKPPLLVCAFRIRARSHDSTESSIRQPNAKNRFDNIIAIRTKYYWLGEDICKESVFTGSEENILNGFFNEILECDPDCFSLSSDFCNPLEYIKIRSIRLNIIPQFSKFLYFEIIKRCEDYLKPRINKGCNDFTNNFGKYYFTCNGRSRVDMVPALTKTMVSPSLEGFTLCVASNHKKVTKEPPVEGLEKFSFIDSTFLDIKTILYQMNEELKIIISIDKSTFKIVGFLELSNYTYCALTDIVQGGQQIRVWGVFKHTFFKKNLLANKEKLKQVPIMVNMREEKSSYPSPPEVPNNPFSHSVKPIKRKYKNVITSNGIVKVYENDEKEEEKETDGGHVIYPKIGAHLKNSQFTYVLDFKSLYPSIIIAFLICYMRICFDRKYLNDPNYECEYIFTDKKNNRCFVMVKSKNGIPVDTFLPYVTDYAMEQRKLAKEMMKKEKYKSFGYEMYNAKQLVCKIFQNSVYGFTGTASSPIFAFRQLMKTVCCLGRFMLRTAKHYIITIGKGYVVYGDTDSVMAQFDFPVFETDIKTLEYSYPFVHKIAEECTKLFNYPNELEFETAKKMVLLKKKTYFSKEFGLDLTKGFSWSIKGCPFKKRDRCPWVNKTGTIIVKMLLNEQHEQIIPFLTRECQKLLRYEIPIDDLAVSCLIKANYKNENLIQVKTAKKLMEATGKEIIPGTRLKFVFIKNPNKKHKNHADFGMEINLFNESKKKICRDYYLRIQFGKPIGMLFKLTQYKKLDDHFQSLLIRCLRSAQSSIPKNDFFKKRKIKSPNFFSKKRKKDYD